ncbi:hypothetical protein QUA40_25485 [Microcoleus sp. Pol11C3]|uniref:hypothetical protein n=1 Tax=Microcoleus sp. Pol11C3 TaxID=3055390 RepID=UPI002FD4EE48
MQGFQVRFYVINSVQLLNDPTIWGGRGSDTLVGEEGSDTLVAATQNTLDNC